MTDHEVELKLRKRCLAMLNDHEKTRQLIQEWQGRIYDFAARRLRNEADAADVTQDALLALLRDRHQLRSPDKLRPWVYRLTLNAVMNHRRGRQRQQSRLEKVARERVGESAADLVTRRQGNSFLKSKVESLPEDLRELVVLRYFHNLTQVEISELLDLPRGTVRSRLDRALSSLRESMSGAGAPVFGLGLEQSLQLLNPDPIPLHVSSSLQTALIPSLGKGAWTLGGFIMKLKLTAAALIVLGAGVLIDRAWSQGRQPKSSEKEAALEDKLAILKQGYRDLKAKQSKQRKEEAALRERSIDLERQLEASKGQVAELRVALKSQRSQALALKKKEPSSKDLVGTQKEAVVSKAMKGLEEIMDLLVPLGDPFLLTLEEKREARETIQKVEQKIRVYKEDPLGLASMLVTMIKRTKDSKKQGYAALLLGSLGNEIRRLPFSEDLHKGMLAIVRDGKQRSKVRNLALRAMQQGGDSKLFTELLSDLIRENEGAFREAALVQLAGIATEEARKKALWVLIDGHENLALRIEILQSLDFKALRQGFPELLKCLRSEFEPLQNAAIEKTEFCPPRKDLREQLEEMLRSAKAENRIYSLGQALQVQGGASSLTLIEQIRDDKSKSLELRGFMESIAKALRARLKRE